MSVNRTIGAYEAKTHLPRLLDEVAKGASITITKHGVPVAVLVPPQGKSKKTVEEILGGFARVRQGSRLDGLAIREMIEKGRL
jgi:prevent-host-death family protein